MKKYLLLITVFQFQFLILNAQFGQALKFNGTTDYLELPDNNYFDLGTDFTIEATINLYKTQGTANIINKVWCNNNRFSFNLAAVDGKILWQWSSSGNCASPSRYRTLDTVISISTCYHLAVVHSSTSIKIYVNGVEVPGQLEVGSYSSVFNSDAEIRIGAYRNLSGNVVDFYWGMTDEVRFWNYKLSQTEINNNLFSPLTGNETGLIAYYDMEDTGIGQNVVITNKALVSGSVINGLTHGTAVSPCFMASCNIVNDDITVIQDISVYPNPANSEITIDSKYNTMTEVYDIYGTCIQMATNKRTIDLSQIPPGVYFLHIEDNNKTIIKKVVKL